MSWFKKNRPLSKIQPSNNVRHCDTCNNNGKKLVKLLDEIFQIARKISYVLFDLKDKDYTNPLAHRGICPFLTIGFILLQITYLFYIFYVGFETLKICSNH